MKIIKRKLAVSALAVLLMLGGCGCMGLLRQTKSDPTEAALAYMAQRYGLEFVYDGPWGAGYADAPVKKLLVAPSDGETGARILVEVRETEEGYQFQDNYLAVKYEGEMRQALQQAAESAFETACVFYEAATIALSSELPADATFAQYSQDDSSSIIATVAVPECQDGQGRTETLEEALKKAGIHGLIRLVVLSQEQFDSATAESVRATIGKETYVRYAVLTIDGKTAQPPAEE